MSERAHSVTTHGEGQTAALAARLAAALRPGDVVALRGELGAGKTRFVRGLAAALGADSTLVSSPTFVLANHYACDGSQGVAELVHIDAYRVRSAEELEWAGWDALAAGGAVLAVEWAERAGAILPPPGERFEVLLEHAGEESRRVTVRWPRGRGVDFS
ncbi:MAG TPA: tRNA (adenosine(37)-N6)-threonylcarbamoyltransferase complex ATPase subunit type 1 TsaE [Phycisphaerales bacterium]|nr:tRNA (adenosine(37)-N6)-threonylcarbamoyltransferase complex ATPase subunit type 1 TsaE [Phycisphaerales bacterium]